MHNLCARVDIRVYAKCARIIHVYVVRIILSCTISQHGNRRNLSNEFQAYVPQSLFLQIWDFHLWYSFILAVNNLGRVLLRTVSSTSLDSVVELGGNSQLSANSSLSVCLCARLSFSASMNLIAQCRLTVLTKSNAKNAQNVQISFFVPVTFPQKFARKVWVKFHSILSPNSLKQRAIFLWSFIKQKKIHKHKQ